MELMLRENLTVIKRMARSMQVGWWGQYLAMDASGGIEHEAVRDHAFSEILASPFGSLKRQVDLRAEAEVMPSVAGFREGAFKHSDLTLEEFLALWSAFVDRTITKYEPRIVCVWPEWTDATAWGVADKTNLVTDYTLLLRHTAEAVKGRAQVCIGGFFLAAQPLWWPLLLEAGALDVADGVALHPYTHERDLSAVLAFQERQIAAMADRNKVYITEMGLPIVNDNTKLHGRQPETTPDESGRVEALTESEAARWWAVLLDMYDAYAECCHAMVSTRPPTDHWGSRISIGQWPEVMDVFRKFFKVK